MSRGRLTPEIQALSKEMLGIEIDQKQLRIMPYLQYTMMNEQVLDARKLDGEEIAIISDWSMKKWIIYAEDGKYIRASEEFWIAMNRILYFSYVNTKES